MEVQQQDNQLQPQYLQNADLGILEFQDEAHAPPLNVTNNPPVQAPAETPLGHPDPANLPPIRDKLNHFRNYVHHAQCQYYPLGANVRAGIELMKLMDECGGSMKLFDAVFKWHQCHLETTDRVTATQLIRQLEARYNCTATKPFEVPVTLPSNNEKILLPLHDVGSQLLNLLTNPQIQEEDYL